MGLDSLTPQINVTFLTYITITTYRHKQTRPDHTTLQMAGLETNRQKTDTPEYKLLYHPGLPGRGEYIRLAFEATSTPYTDVSNTSQAGIGEVYGTLSPQSLGEGLNPPKFAPPMLRVGGAGPNGSDLLISQTSNVLLYLGRKLGLSGESEAEGYWVNEVVLTGLDFCNDCHDTHHPIATGMFYEDQKDEALKKASDFRENRIPKFLGYFERVLRGNGARAQGKYLVGKGLTAADLVVWQVVDGVRYAFPKEMEARMKEFEGVWEFYESLKGESWLEEYLASERRLKYGDGIFRYYKELDRQ